MIDLFFGGQAAWFAVPAIVGTFFFALRLIMLLMGAAAGVVDGRHALVCCLAGDTAGFFGAVAACHFFFG